ncbi:hypothetical protein ACOSP7_029542 [Xanthoceras sorbifolium]|uniref:Tify domain-containing protein n=1 Tax=Xanthoceras sorbifolium TaxID=99658 RepID=A0ABQ8HAY1_9ROSI|nr:hypothetical protein JRO89_XS12G0039000 [Xanthoceras sorbifolium]
MNQGFWIEKGAGCLNDGDMAYDNSSRADPKRPYQYFMDGPEADLFPNKKQAVGTPANNSFSGLLNSNVPPWGHASNFQSIPGSFNERLFDSATARNSFHDRDVTSVSTEKVDPGRKVSDDLLGNDSSFSLSMSQTLEDPRSGLSYGGIRKVKVNQVRDSENVMAVSMGLGYDTVDTNTMSMVHSYNKADDSSVSMGLAYNKADGNIMSIGDAYVRENNIFISMGQPYNKGDENLSMGQTYKENNDTITMGHTFSKGDSNLISMGQTYNKLDDNTISMGHIYNKGDDSTISMGHIYNKGDDSTISMGHNYDKDDNSSLSIGQSYNKGESTIISFGGYDDDANPSGRLLSSYEILMGQSSINRAEELNQKELVRSNVDILVSGDQVTVSGNENIARKKEDLKSSKKAPSNNFPSNVRSLLSTGMLDGVPVKYIAWSREKELRGVIKGSGYQCSCQSCNYSKVINAYEFERHAGCKTKHPNNHIYFENGKTIYGIVQELRSTPQSMLFEVIQTITGSPINQKSFRLWKESFLAATRELQRIYGKDEGKQLS